MGHKTKKTPPRDIKVHEYTSQQGLIDLKSLSYKIFNVLIKVI